MVQDESYFVGALRQKNNELTAEISSIRGKVKTLQRDQDSYQSYEKRAEGLAAEIKELQGELGDLNTMEEQVNQHIETTDVQDEVDDMRRLNDKTEQDNDEIFAQRQRSETALKQVEADVTAEKNKAEELVAELSPDQQELYRAKQTECKQMEETLSQQTGHIDALEADMQACQSELQKNPIKRQAVDLKREIADLENRRDTIKREVEESDMGTPEEQKERLLQQVKSNNQNIATMERSINELGNRQDQIQAEIADLESADDNHSDEKRQKYLELVKRDQEMDKFLDDFEGIRNAERQLLDEAEESIEELLVNISDLLQRTGTMPDRARLKKDREALAFKKGEMSKAEQTKATLQERRDRLRKDMQNVQSLETKIVNEMTELKQRIETMEGGLVLYEDIDGLKKNTDDKKQQLMDDRKSLDRRSQKSKGILREQEAQYEALKEALDKNETYQNLGALQKKWQGVAKANQQMLSFVSAQEIKSNWKPISKEVAVLIKKNNDDLKTRDPVRNISRAV